MADLPDFFSPFVVKGFDGSQYRTLKVTETGELYILLSALYNSTIMGLKCDADGNALLNVKAQDLAEIINRPKYGTAKRSNGFDLCSQSEWTLLTSISGKGIIYAGNVHVHQVVDHKPDYIKIVIDTTSVTTLSFEGMNLRQLHALYSDLAYLLVYDEVNHKYMIGLSPNITFETELKIYYWNTLADTIPVDHSLVYALV